MTLYGDEQPVLTSIPPVGSASPAPQLISPIMRRLADASITIGDEPSSSVVYQHTVLCQTCLPYRNPGDQVRVWNRENGRVALQVRAGVAKHPQNGWIDVGLPFGPKPRLILSYLNTQAIRKQSAVIDVGDSLTSFIRRIGLAIHGRNFFTIKDQLTRLAAADLNFGVPTSERTATTYKGQIVGEFSLWFAKDDRQRVLWPTTVTLDKDYFETIKQHAVPLDERALAALSHSAMALDVYAWLAQRLHRVEASKDAFVAWERLRQQFGFAHKHMRKFKEVFRIVIGQVRAVYPSALLYLDDTGATLKHSPPPVPKRW